MCMHRGNWRKDTPGAVAPWHPDFNDLQQKGETPELMFLTTLQQTRVGSVGAWAEEGTLVTGRSSAVYPTWALSSLVLIDLPLSRGTHSACLRGQEGWHWAGTPGTL